jgi:hypothetical protein
MPQATETTKRNIHRFRRNGRMQVKFRSHFQSRPPKCSGLAQDQPQLVERKALPETFCFIVEFRDPETDQVLAEIGRAETEPTCRELIRHEMTCWYIQGYEFLNAECCGAEKVSGPELRVRKPIPEVVASWHHELSAA